MSEEGFPLWSEKRRMPSRNEYSEWLCRWTNSGLPFMTLL